MVHSPTLRSWLADGGEIAVLDVREQGEFQQGHLMVASSLPLSDLELRIGTLVPRKSTRLVVCDGSQGDLAEPAALRLAQLGYGNVHVLDGGVEGWELGGGVLFAMFNVGPKVFGAHVAQDLSVPSVSAKELRCAFDSGDDILLVDVRPIDEFREATIPGAHNFPGVELLPAVLGRVRSRTTRIVTHCISRTRGILAAQSLINAGLENPVAFLDDGAMAWAISGGRLVPGTPEPLGRPDPTVLAEAAQRSERLAAALGISRITGSDLERFWSDRHRRSVYLLDVRTRAEYLHGHRAGALWAPGGQLVQGIDDWVATQHARLVLADTADGVRAMQTASWLVQLGWNDVFVLAEDLHPGNAESGPARFETIGSVLAPSIESDELARALSAGAVTIIDVAKSRAYTAGHIPGAWFAIRSQIGRAIRALAGVREFVVTSPDGVLANLVASEACSWTERPVCALKGGTQAWADAGFDLEEGAERVLSPPIDVFDSMWDHGAGSLHRFAQYLDWEHQLYDASIKDGTSFRILA
jgi:rhodanese-related sulfurtransferase